jgi:peptidoglycan hydrolase CwlO-like protein
MPADQRLDRIETNLEKTTQAQARTEANLDRLTQVVSTIAASVAAHDEQIESLLKVAEVQNQRMDKLTQNWEQLQREWQAYLRTIHPAQ